MTLSAAEFEQPKVSRIGWLRGVAIGVLAISALTVFYLLRDTSLEHHLRDQAAIQDWVHRHAVIAPILLISMYILMTALIAPVWELQIAAGYGFGLVVGVMWCEIAAVIGAILATLISRWLIGDWVRIRYESRVARLHAFNEKLGHNGLLAVMGVRLCHVLPFSLSSYLFGLTPISVIDVFLGTLLGSLPALTFYVAIGVNPHLLQHPFEHWRFVAGLGLMNMLLLIPLALRYLKPEWFKRIGVE